MNHDNSTQIFFEPTDVLWWKILAETYNPDRGYMLLFLS